MSKECICPWTTGQNLLTWLHSGPKVDAVCKSNSGSTLQYVTNGANESLTLSKIEGIKIYLLVLNCTNTQSGQALIDKAKEIYCSFASLGCFLLNTNGFPKITQPITWPCHTRPHG